MTPVLVAVMGPTGSGKSSLAESLALRLDAQLINADAFQVYVGLDIGTNKPADPSKYLLLDFVEPTKGFGVGRWVAQAHEAITRLWSEQRSVVVVGGTGLYIRALFEQYAGMKAPPSAEVRQTLMERESSEGLAQLVSELLEKDPSTKVDLQNPVRVRRALERLATPDEPFGFALPPFEKHKFSLNPSFEELEPRLNSRLKDMFEAGWVEEVETLLNKGVPLSAPGFRAIGYQSLSGFLSGQADWDTTVETIFRATRQYAKRQKTWLRSEPDLIELSIKLIDDCGTKQASDEAMQVVSGRGVR